MATFMIEHAHQVLGNVLGLPVKLPDLLRPMRLSNSLVNDHEKTPAKPTKQKHEKNDGDDGSTYLPYPALALSPIQFIKLKNIGKTSACKTASWCRP